MQAQEYSVISRRIFSVCLRLLFRAAPNHHLHLPSFRLLVYNLRLKYRSRITYQTFKVCVIITRHIRTRVNSISEASYDSMNLTVFMLIALTTFVGIVQAVPATFTEDPCSNVCRASLPRCPGGMYANNKGTGAHPCWTCCRALDYDLGSQVTFAMQANTCPYPKS